MSDLFVFYRLFCIGSWCWGNCCYVFLNGYDFGICIYCDYIVNFCLKYYWCDFDFDFFIVGGGFVCGYGGFDRFVV